MQFIDGFVFLLGLCWGSFLNVLIYRIPRGESIVKPASHCPTCKISIRPIDNIPLISYLLLRGRCRFCQGRISFRYPAVEALTAIIFLLLYKRFGWDWQEFIYIPLASILIIIAFIDLEHYLIPDRLTYPAIGLGLPISLLPGGVSLGEAVIGLVVGGGLIYLLTVLSPLLFGKEGMGGGDVKLAAVMGVYLGWEKTLIALFIASLLGSLVGISLILLKKKGRGDYIPFGPYLVAGTLVMLIWPDVIIWGV